MGLVERLQTNGSSLSKFDGSTPSIPVGATDQSALHRNYSFDGAPNLSEYPPPSLLDVRKALIGNFSIPPKYLNTDPKVNSVLHNTYSINGDPNYIQIGTAGAFFGTMPLFGPSGLDLNGIDVPKYLDTDPKANSTLHKAYSINGDPDNTTLFFGAMPLPSPTGGPTQDLDGIDVPKYLDTDPKANSILHKTYSINGNPNMTGMFFGTMPLPSPTAGPTQDLNGINIPKYLDTDPKANSILHKTYSINGNPNMTGMFFGTMPLPNPTGGSTQDLDGINIPKYLDTDPKVNSKLHNEYSVNGNPNLMGAPQPSLLDLNGVTPPKYLDTPPQ